MTEKDLIRQVASNITKEHLIVKKRNQVEGGEVVLTEKLQSKNVTDGKRLMTENIANMVKIWQSFSKFIKNQVMTNGRLVDTQLIGLFGKDANGDAFYMPSREYLEAGKFRLQKGPGSLFQKL